MILKVVLVVWSKIFIEEYYVRDVCKFFCIVIMKFIMNVGGYVNVVNNRGNIFFYLVVIYKFSIGGL